MYSCKFLKRNRLSIDLMENHTQALFLMAMDKQVIAVCITDHVCS